MIEQTRETTPASKLEGRTVTVDWKTVKINELIPTLVKESASALKAVDAIANSTATPTLENTLQAFLNSQEKVENVMKIFSTLQSNLLDEDLKKIQSEFEQKSVEYSNTLYFHSGFYKRLKTLHAMFPKEYAVEKLMNEFVRQGADLSEEKKKQLADVNKEMKELTTTFGNNHLHRLQVLKVIVDNESELDGVPKATIEKIKKDGKYVIQFRDSTAEQVLMFCTNRKLREKVSYATAQVEIASKYLSKEELGDTESDDNRPVVLKLIAARARHAKIMGYKTHADYQLDDRMAKTPAKARALTEEILNAAFKKAKKEIKELETYAKSKGKIDHLEPWDVSFYTAMYEKENLNFDENEFKKYFEYNHTFQKTLDFIGHLYNIEFKEDPSVSTYHKDVKAFRVTDKTLHKEIGVLLVDPFTREIKQSGAWANGDADQGLFSDGMHRPLASVHFNFDPPHGDHPTLLKVREAETVLHELGHAMHALFSDVKYRNLNGFNVPWDFVEFPSTVMENWLSEPEYIELVSKNIETGKTLPPSWLEKIRKKQNFQKAMVYLRTASFALMDLEWHTNGPKDGESVLDFEKRVRGPYSLFPNRPLTLLSPRFSHLFNGGYSAGYYSYLWSETIEADGFAYWNEKPKEREKRARALREKILSQGGSLPPTELYISWRGRDFTTEAFFKKNGLD